ncbi:MAG: UDP-N-acetylmuramate--L-alanine ligase [Bacilli bacterium]
MAVQRDSAEDAIHVHFVGIGGVGMSAIASILLDKGHKVSGSDVALQEYTRRLSERGAHVFAGHDAANIEGADFVVYTTAVAADNVELQAARALHIPVLHRSEMLAELMKEGHGIAVAGAHGKTTTTSMVAWILECSGLDPTFLIGGVVANLNTGAKAGKGQYVVAEADESDGSFLNYEPAIAVVTNIEADHLEHYDGDFDNLKVAYRRFMQRIPAHGVLITCADDRRVRELLADVRCRLVTYSVQGLEADLAARDIEFVGRGTRSDVYWHGERLGALTLHVPGAHNVGNALAAIGVALDIGISFAAAIGALAEFRGALRRFQVLFDENGLMVVDDYAHHPTEISAMIRAAKATGKRIVAVFQPQRYTRTFHLFDEFTRAFSEADDVVIADIYSPAGEQPIEGVNAARLVEGIREHSHAQAKYCPGHDDVIAYLKEHVGPGDLVMTMGAGDIWKVGKEFAAWLSAR